MHGLPFVEQMSNPELLAIPSHATAAQVAPPVWVVHITFVGFIARYDHWCSFPTSSLDNILNIIKTARKEEVFNAVPG